MKKLLILLSALLLLGCSSVVALTSEPTPSPKQFKETITPDIQKTATIHNKDIQTRCLVAKSSISQDVLSKSTLVLDNRANDGSGKNQFETYLLNMSTLEKIQIAKPKENLEYFSVSPNRKWIAYNESQLDANMNYLTNNLVITNTDNQVVKQVPWEKEWGAIQWLDNNRLIIGYQPQDILDNPVARSSTLLVFNPFTKERKIIKPDFPGIYDLSPIPNWDGWGETAYNSYLDQVVYLKGDANSPLNYIFWDINKQKQIANFRIAGEMNAVPRWAPDGQHFAFAPSLLLPSQQWPRYEFYDVTRDGQITQLTHLANYFPWVYIADFNWSPDGKYIAFWFSYWLDKEIDTNSRVTQYLAVLNISSGLVTNYCIPGEINAPIGSRKTPPPLWSPDGLQIVVQSQITEDSFDVILIDIKSSEAFQIGKDLEPVGWMLLP